MRSAQTVLLSLSLAGAGLWSTQAIADRDLLIKVHIENPNVEFGKAFALTVQRVWNRNLSPQNWDDETLAPIVLRPIETTQRKDSRHIEETRRFQAYLFRHGKVTVPTTEFRAYPKNGGLMRKAVCDAFELNVIAGLDPNDVGNIEVLELLPRPASSWLAWSTAGLTMLAGLSFLAYNLAQRKAAPVHSENEPGRDPYLHATQRLHALRDQRPIGDEENRAFYVETSDLLRRYIEDQFALRARCMTTDEFLCAAQTMRALETGNRRILSGFLQTCDLAKFSGQQPGAEQRERCLDEAQAFLDATRPEHKQAGAA